MRLTAVSEIEFKYFACSKLKLSPSALLISSTALTFHEKALSD